MRPTIAIDASLLAIPNSADTAAAVEDILAAINDWAAASEDQNCCRFVVCSNVIEVLQTANCFPATQNIAALLDLYNLSHVFSPKDINSRIFSLINRSERVVDAFGTEVLDCQEFDSPDIVVADTHCAIVESTACLLASILKSLEPAMSRAVLGYRTSAYSVQVSTQISKVEVADVGEHDISPPEAIVGPIPVVTKPQEYLMSLDPSLIWRHANDPTQVHMAISLEIAAEMGIHIEELPLSVQNRTFRIGTEFCNSLARNDAVGEKRYAEVVRKKCAQYVVGKIDLDTGISEERRSRDGAKSVRVHITKHREALRLMSWECASGQLEFANIGPKSELKIEEGTDNAHHGARFKFN